LYHSITDLLLLALSKKFPIPPTSSDLNPSLGHLSFNTESV